MQFTPEILRKHAQVLVDKEVKKDRNIQAAYLRGSLLYGSPLIGGVGDIDLVFIHNSPPSQEREIRKLTPEVFFDIEHHDQLLYKTPRELRLDPWFGPSLRDAVPLYDPRHLLDYTQSGVRSNFDFPENIQTRSQTLLSQARQFWLDRQINPPLEIIQELPAFLSALEKALNAVALLSGPPLAIRRLGREFPLRASQANAPGLGVAFEHLMGVVKIPQDKLSGWLNDWTKAFKILQSQSNHESSLADQEIYFLSAIEEYLQNEAGLAGLWPLLNTWTEIVTILPDNVQLLPPWIGALTSLGFAGSDYQVRLAALDGFLELCESLIAKEIDSAV
jgi:hypothetical protein